MRVFLSSTCYGLVDLRASLERGLRELGHAPILSDRETFPVRASIHRHDCCLEEAGKADLVILVIDKAFGAPYYKDPKISITWAEVRAALAARVPVFAFVRRSIFDERMSYLKNTKLGHPFVPFFCDRTTTFDFISELQSQTGVWVQSFDDVTHIHHQLPRLKELVIAQRGPEPVTDRAIAVSDGRIQVDVLSREVRDYAIAYGELGATDSSVPLATLKRLADFIPTGSQYIGILMDFELREPAETAPWYDSPIRPADDDGSSWYAARIPTPHGLRLRHDIEEILARAGYATQSA